MGDVCGGLLQIGWFMAISNAYTRLSFAPHVRMHARTYGHPRIHTHTHAYTRMYCVMNQFDESVDADPHTLHSAPALDQPLRGSLSKKVSSGASSSSVMVGG